MSESTSQLREEPLPTAVRWAQTVLHSRLRKGDIVVDATAGNGHDSLFLAQQVLPGGQLFIFDVQAEALRQTRVRLTENGVPLDAVTFLHAGHETLDTALPETLRGKVRAIMFNLGYLPGGDKQLITQPATTMIALQSSLDWLDTDGLLTVVAYPGHDGGREEALALEDWTSALPVDRFEAQKIAYLNFRPTTPFCLVVRKRVIK